MCLDYVHICVPCVPVPEETEEGLGSPETSYMSGCEPPCRWWELNLGLLQEQEILLTTGPFLQAKFFFLSFKLAFTEVLTCFPTVLKVQEKLRKNCC